MTKHTPGPWALDDKTGTISWGDCSFGAPAGAGGFVVASHSVCNIPRHQSERITDEHRANALLIAAAPELFRSARMWIEYLDSPSPDGSGELEEQILGDMRAAIAKAKGAVP